VYVGGTTVTDGGCTVETLGITVDDEVTRSDTLANIVSEGKLGFDVNGTLEDTQLTKPIIVTKRRKKQVALCFIFYHSIIGLARWEGLEQ
jgi:hypothetical protein